MNNSAETSIPKVSCLIAVYNVEKYIKQTLDSVVNQKNCEIIVVNDGSTDKSYDILKEYEEKYNNIIIVTQENGGLSAARNSGIPLARGEYIHFLDGDDELAENAYEKLYEYADIHKPDILIFDYYKYYVESGKRVNKTRNLKQDYNYVLNKSSVLKAGVVTWNKFFRRDFLLQNKLSFIPSLAYEDMPFFWQSTLVAKRIYYMHGYFIKYNQRSGSLNAKTNLEGMIFTNNLIFNFLQSNADYAEYRTLFVNKMLKSYISLLKRIKTKEAFALVQNNTRFIDLKEYKFNLIKYIKFYILLSSNYRLFSMVQKFL